MNKNEIIVLVVVAVFIFNLVQAGLVHLIAYENYDIDKIEQWLNTEV